MKLSDGKIHTFEVRHGLGEINMSVGEKALVNSSCGFSCNLQNSSKWKNYHSYKPGLESTLYLSAYQSLGANAKWKDGWKKKGFHPS